MERIKEALQKLFNQAGYAVVRKENVVEGKRLHQQDGLISWHNDAFIREPRFAGAYARGLRAARGIYPRHHWRVRVALWAANVAMGVKGDFVECGVNAGFMSSAIMEYLDWESTGRRFFLVDTFGGPPMDQFTDAERANGLAEQIGVSVARGGYVTDMGRIRENFSQWSRAEIVVVAVPGALEHLVVEKLAFLHLDLNAAQPEGQALEHFWPSLANGGIVLLDDYAFYGYGELKKVVDNLGEALGYQALSLPTGQGLIIKRQNQEW